MDKSRGQPNKTMDVRKKEDNNLMTLLIAQIERPISEKTEGYLCNEYIVTKISDQKLGGRNPLKFNEVKRSKWRKRKYHRVHSMLQKVWRECLSNKEKYNFWFKYFNTLEKVRLWN